MTEISEYVCSATLGMVGDTYLCLQPREVTMAVGHAACKKKCDENRPVCSACISLELDCHGYSPRPKWMDNGLLQRDQACKFKRLVSQAKSKKERRQQFLASPKSLTGMRSSASTKDNPSPAPVSQHFFDEHLVTFPQLGDNLNSTYHDSRIGSSTPIESLWNLWPQNDLSMMNDASMDLESYSFAYTIGRNQHSPPNVISPMAFETIISGWESPSPIDHSSSSSLNKPPDSFSQNHRYQSKEPAPTANDYDHVGPSQAANPGAGTEDALSMYHLDEVFFIQHPLFSSQKKKKKTRKRLAVCDPPKSEIGIPCSFSPERTPHSFKLIITKKRHFSWSH